MKYVAALLALAAIASAASLSEFRAWAARHNKVYTAEEEMRRFSVFESTLKTIEKLNRISTGAKFGVNKFSDLTNAEFAKTHTTDLMLQDPIEKSLLALPDTSMDGVKDSVDYRSWLPAVKNQGQCGSCWAFSAVANMEGQTYKKNNGTVISLSEQQLVSCNYYFNLECHGGNPFFADLYALEQGMTTEELYPYVSGDGIMYRCHNYTPVATFRHAHQWIALKDAGLLEKLTTFGPIIVAIEADKECFRNYKSGVLDTDECACGVMVNHGVTLVGYGTDEASGKPYWLVRNSWGPDWGENGYVKLVRGKNICQINQRPGSIEA